MNGATCAPMYEDNDHHCACPLGYHGKDCEDNLGINLSGFDN